SGVDAVYAVPVTGGGFRCGGCDTVLPTVDEVFEHQRREDGGGECRRNAKQRGRWRFKAKKKYEPHPREPRREYVPVAVARATTPVTEALEGFGKSILHGPSFPCLVCHGNAFRHEVCKVEEVGGLEAGGPRRVRYVAGKYVTDKHGMFVRLGHEWCCLPCRKSIEADRMPKLAAVNRLEPTWDKLPAELSHLSDLEVELCGLMQPLGHADGLTVGVAGVGGPSKTLHYVWPDVADVSGLADVAEDPRAILHQHHARPAGQPAVVSAVAVRGAWARLLDINPLYRTNLSASEEDRMVTGMLDESPELAYLDSQQQADLPTAAWMESVDPWTAAGPRFGQLEGVVLPGAAGVMLPEKFRRLAAVKSLDAKSGGGHFDTDNAAGMDTQREVAVSQREWLQARLANVRRDGPTQHPQLLLAWIAQMDSRRLVEVGGATGGWRRHVGSKFYWAKIRDDMAATAAWRG
ncbi:MAG: hypothetical protein NZ658_07655, partial [Pirellulales bacterium]|nr:hypothetical protein [Pirellulales bacterium]